MSTSTLAPTPQSAQVMYKRVSKDAGTALLAVLEKFSVSEQVELRRGQRLLPKVLVAAWRELYDCLDFQEFQNQLIGDALQQFLRKMRRYFTSVRFNGDQLQEQLNLLERSGIAELPAVRECIITWDASKRNSFSMWPLHSLPKIMARLHYLVLHIPVQIGFLEQFGHLKSLTLHSDAPPEILAAAWTGCARLKRLQLLGRGPADLTGISKCERLSELTLSVTAISETNVSEIAQIPLLKFLELQQQDCSAEATLAAISLLLQSRANDIQTLQVNGSRLGKAEWLAQLELQRCRRLDGLMLIDCRFGKMNMATMGRLPMLSYAAFCQCSDLSDKQVLEFAGLAPKLSQLYLIGCANLTPALLLKLFNKRYLDQLGVPPLGLFLQDGEPLHKEFIANFGKQSSLELLETPLEDSHMQHVQFIFLPAESTQ